MFELMTDQTNSTQRFVSLYGFFSFNHPKLWKQETDAAGHYIFSNDAGGSGVVRIMVLDNEYKGDDAAKKLLEEVYNQNKDFSPSLLAVGTNRFVQYTKEHNINGGNFTVYYWVTAAQDKAVLITYTVQTSMKEMATAVSEREEMERLVASFEFMHDTAKHG